MHLKKEDNEKVIATGPLANSLERAAIVLYAQISALFIRH
jgi:hypothetical protein